MGIAIDEDLRTDIINCCTKYGCSEIIAFGSRARGDNTNTSDLDLAIRGSSDFDSLFCDLKYNEFTLLRLDIVNLEDNLSNDLLQQIEQKVKLFEENSYLMS